MTHANRTPIAAQQPRSDGAARPRRLMPGAAIACALFAVCAFGARTAVAQGVSAAPQVQVPTLQVCNRTLLQSDNATVSIAARAGGATLRGVLKCDPTVNNMDAVYPNGVLGLYDVNMNDDSIPAGADIVFSTFEQTTSTGRVTPTAWVNGRCEVRQNGVLLDFPGCRYWLMAVDNTTNPEGLHGKTPDIVSFLIFGRLGRRIAYGTGPVVDGDVFVAPTTN